MCTFTIVPDQNKLVITSNRDEHISRGIALFPIRQVKAGKTIVFPKDPLAGGTWLAASKNDVTVLLNGGLEKHKHLPPYAKSRGIVVLDRFDYVDFNTFCKDYILSGIEPFTMVNININSREVTDIVWTGKEKLVRHYPVNTPLIWSSSTLYSKKIRANRENWFEKWVKKNETSSGNMLEFHQFNHGDSKNGILMNRNNGLKTVSISQIIIDSKSTKGHFFSHYNLLNNTHNKATF